MSSVKAMKFLSLYILLNLSFYATNGLAITEADDNVRELLLDLHNEVRVKHGAPLMDLDANLNKQAQRCARFYANINKINETCPYRQDYGENLFQILNLKDSTTVEDAVRGAVKWWYHDQKDNYDYATGHPKDEKKKYLAFTQMVWKATTKLGVGTAKTETTLYLAALYDPSGNIDDQFTKNVEQPK